MYNDVIYKKSGGIFVKSVLIICEYNPFHNGHAYQIEKAKELFPNASVISLMSPNFVQRGECALFDKYTRAEAALIGGSDLVLSLPFVFATLSAEGFAEAGVAIAEALGVDALLFGAEEENTQTLFEIAKLQLSDFFAKEVENKCRHLPSLSLQQAGERVVRENLGEDFADAVKKPNNILALEYIKAILKTGSKIVPFPIKRKGEEYKSLDDADFPSATLVRKKILNFEDIQNNVPEKCREIYEKKIRDGFFASPDKYSSLLRSALLLKSAEELGTLFKNREIGARLFSNLRECENFEDAVLKSATVRITRARIKRAALSALFGIPHNRFIHNAPEYTQVLAMGEKGREFLSSQRKNEKLIILTKSADYIKYIGNASFKEQFSIEMRADEIWASITHKPCPANIFMKTSPKVKER